MDNKYYTISKRNFFDLLGRLTASHRIIVPYRKGDRLYFDDFDPKKEDIIELGGIRQSQPLKSFLNPPRESMSGAKKSDTRPVIIAGVKGCDLSSLILQDYVFLQGDYVDPFYSDYRNRTILIGNDCTYAKETCFCLAMEGAPYPTKYFDISLSVIDDHFVAEVASGKGVSLVNDFKMFFRPAGGDAAGSREAARNKVSSQVRDFIDKRGTKNTSEINGAVKKNYNLTALWQDFASTCVECGACNLVCPTCHCFLLFDEGSESCGAKRTRIWDACLYKTFARVAGNANPRKQLYERLRNRFEKKFDFFPQVLDYFACTGCGRCIEACPGDIDLREVLKGLVLGQWNKPPND
ncbi:MAG: 4Fe-4S dicluster domain-containing protein [Candidatus Omnitrophota bacterium]|nr:4Fe-4S dicluster domain-containing protein [Candidatus Omnitrophota bacterium]